MKGFHFRSERILEWRRVQADAARVAFVRANESAREADAQARNAQADASRTADDYVTAMKSGTSVDTIERYRNWIARQRVHVAGCQKTSGERREVADAASQALQTANRHVKVMERLRERAVARFVEAERQRDMKALDQLATLQYVRRRREGSTHSGS